MIERYTRPAMGRVWTDEAKYAAWLRVELAVCEAHARRGRIPADALARIRARCRVDVARVAAILARVKHEMIALLASLEEQLGEDSRFVPVGLTSNDVWDTALALQLCEASDLLVAGQTRLREALRALALRHKDTVIVGRTHGVHAEPTTFGLKVAVWFTEAERNLERLRRALTVYEGMSGMMENVFINVKGRSHSVNGEVEIPKNGAKGVILSQAGRFGGWSLYVKDGKPTYTYNWLGLNRYTIAAGQSLPPGKATIPFEFAYDGGGVGKGGLGTIFVNGKRVAEGRIEKTQLFFSADEGADVGEDRETPVVEDYGIAAPYKFNGKIDKITIDLKEIKTADKVVIEKATKEAAHKKALSD